MASSTAGIEGRAETQAPVASTHATRVRSKNIQTDIFPVAHGYNSLRRISEVQRLLAEERAKAPSPPDNAHQLSQGVKRKRDRQDQGPSGSKAKRNKSSEERKQ
jgi:hypothetical protein